MAKAGDFALANFIDPSNKRYTITNLFRNFERLKWKIAVILYAQNREVTESLALIEQTSKTFKANDVGDAHLGHALVLRGNLFDRAQNPQAAVRDWRDARAIFVAAYGTQDDRVLELTKLLAR